jgi:hypothetical protein
MDLKSERLQSVTEIMSVWMAPCGRTRLVWEQVAGPIARGVF